MSESKTYKQTMDGGNVSKWGAYAMPQTWQNSSIVSGMPAKDVMYADGKEGKSKVNYISSLENQKFSEYTTRRQEDGIVRSSDFGGANT